MKTTYYTAANSTFFVGLVILLNSLALTGNVEELVVLDLGLTKEQKQLLGSLVTVVPLPHALRPRLATLVKPVLHRVRETDVAVWIDSDVMVTGPLEPLVERAAAGAICVFPDPERERWFPEWQDLFALRAPLQRRPYVNAGFFALSTQRWAGLLDRWGELCELIPVERTFAHHAGAPRADPFWASDQDAMNALLMSEVEPDAVELQGEEEEVHCHIPGDVRLVDEQALELRNGAARVTLLHQSLMPKPWMGDAWRNLQKNPYVRLAPRVLFDDDVPLRLDSRAVPAWLRPGRAAAAARRAAITAGRTRRAAYSLFYRIPPRVRMPVSGTMRRFRRRSA